MSLAELGKGHVSLGLEVESLRGIFGGKIVPQGDHVRDCEDGRDDGRERLVGRELLRCVETIAVASKDRVVGW